MDARFLPFLRASHPILEEAVAEILEELSDYVSREGGSLSFLSGKEALLSLNGREGSISGSCDDPNDIRNGFAFALDQWSPGDKIDGPGDLGKYIQILRGFVEAEEYLVRSYHSAERLARIDFSEFIRIKV